MIYGNADDPDIKVKVTGENVTIQDLTFENFGVNCKTTPGATVFEVPDTATNITFLAKNLKIDGFCRNAFYFYAGNVTVENCIITCRNNYTDSEKILVKGISAYGPSADSPVTALVKNTSITGANSNYEEWGAGGIEVWEYADVTVENCTMSSLSYGVVLVDGAAEDQNTTVKIKGEQTSINAVEGAVAIQNCNDSAPSSHMYVEDGAFSGPVGLTYYNDDSDVSGYNTCHDLKISGGVYETNLDEKYVENSSNIVKTSDGKYRVGANANAALASAEEGDTIEIIKAAGPINTNAGVTVINPTGGEITVNGKTVAANTSFTVPAPAKTPVRDTVTIEVGGEKTESEDKAEENPNTGAPAFMGAVVGVLANIK